MVDCDWIGSCIPNTVRPAGSTVTTSAGGGTGEASLTQITVRLDIGRPASADGIGQRLGQSVVASRTGVARTRARL